jgi:hypothetical protein
MKNPKLSLVLIALGLAGAVSALALEHRRREADVSRMRDDLSALSRALGGARQEVAAGSAARRTVEVVTPSCEAPEPTPAAEGVRALPAAQRQLEITEIRDRFAAAFTEQRPDAAWSASARVTAQERIAAALPRTSELRSIECRSSMCRIETAHEDPEHYAQFVQDAFLDPDKHVWDGGFFSTPLEDSREGKLVTVAYLAREDEALPPVWQSP